MMMIFVSEKKYVRKGRYSSLCVRDISDAELSHLKKPGRAKGGKTIGARGGGGRKKKIGAQLTPPPPHNHGTSKLCKLDF